MHTPKREFFNIKANFEPAYMALYRSGELRRRTKTAVEWLNQCLVCPRECAVNRKSKETTVCHTRRHARVSSYFPHLGEEDCLRGWDGSGAIFFSMCSLRCVFCQNSNISQASNGKETPPKRLAAMMLELQVAKCHNINLVTPSHVIPQVLEALVIAVDAGLRLPLVYNTSGYDSLASLRLLDGVVDIYMPDFKVWDPLLSLRYMQARDYPEVARNAIKEMHRQVGELKFDEDGLAKRGVLVRHLVMPGQIADTQAIMRFLAEEVSPDTYVNMMDQYYPSGRVSETKYAEINRRLTESEYQEALQQARAMGVWRFDQRQPRRPWVWG